LQHLTITFAVTLPTLFGWTVARRLHPALSQLRCLGLAIPIGGATFALLGLCMVSLGVNPWWSQLTVLGLAIILTLTTPLNRRTNHDQSSRPRASTVLSCFGFGAVAVGARSVWTFALGVAVIAGSLLLNGRPAKDKRSRTAWLYLAIPVSLSVLGITVSKVGLPQADSNDAPFFEALGATLAYWGGNSHPGTIGGDIWGYHFLAYLWSGLLSRVSDAEPYTALNLYLPFLQGFSVALLLLDERTQSRRTRGLNTVLVFLIILSIRETSFTSLDLANWALIGFIFIHISFGSAPSFSRADTFRHETLLAVIGVVVVLSKGTSLLVVAVISTTAFLLKIQSPGSNSLMARWDRFAPWHLLAIFPVAWLWFFPFADAPLLQTDEMNAVAAIQKLGINDGLWSVRDGLEYTPALALIAVLGFAVRRRTTSGNDLVAGLLGYSSIGIGLLLMLVPNSNVRAYIGSQGFLVAIILIFYLLRNFDGAVIRIDQPRWQWVLTAVVLLAVILWDVFLLPNMMEELWVAAPTRWIPMFLGVSKFPLLLLVPTILLCLSTRTEETRFHTASRFPEILLFFLLSFGGWHIFNQAEQLPAFRQRELINPFTASHPDRSTLEVGAWVRANTDLDTVLATNSFCCRGTAWLDEAVRQLTNPSTESLRNETAFGGANYLLGSVTQRRFLMAGPRFVVATGDSSRVTANRLISSVSYGANGGREELAKLVQAGANCFIIDQQALDATVNLDSFSSAVYVNDRYRIIPLDSECESK
jgi:hypothetical protein